MTASQWSAPRFVAHLGRIWVFTLGALLSPAITIAGEVGQEPLPHGWIGTVDDWARGLGIAFAVLDLVLLAAAWVFLQRSGLTALLKETLFVAVALLPLTVVFFGYQYGLEASKTVDACGACHVMGSHVRDLRDPTSETLAAVHYKNRYIQHDQCYTCHSDYGMFGTLQAKWDGLGHVVRELTRTYTLPLKIARAFPNSRCLYCHGESQKFSKSAGHGTDLMPQFRTGAVSCLVPQSRTPTGGKGAAPMNQPPRGPVLWLAIMTTTVGILICLGLLVRETPYTFVLFMFVGQPLIAAGFFLFAWRILRDLRRTGLL